MFSIVSWCVWFVSIAKLSAQSNYGRFYNTENLPKPYNTGPSNAVAFGSPQARPAIATPVGQASFDEDPNSDFALPEYGSSHMPPMTDPNHYPQNPHANPHLDFCRRCPYCISCTGMRINPQVRQDSIFLAAFAGPRKHSANLQDFANFALQEHMRKFGLAPLTITVADCRVRSSAFRGFVKMCDCSGSRAPEFQLEVNNLGKLFQLYRKHLTVFCEPGVCEVAGFLPRGSITYSFQSARREYEIPFPDRFPVKVQLEWAIRDQQNVMVYSVKRRNILELLRKAAMVTKRIPNSEFVHRVLMNLVERKFDNCYRFREAGEVPDEIRLGSRENGFREGGFREAGFREAGFRDPGFRELGQRDRERDYEYDRDRDRDRDRDGDYMPFRDRQEKPKSSGAVYREI